jgi:hypothetical protein
MEKPPIDDTKRTTPEYEADDNVGVGIVLNASGHKQELQRHFSLLSICSIGITTGNVWAALGGSIVRQPLSFTTRFPEKCSLLYLSQVIALYNGGAPGVIYEFIAVSVFYWMIAACIAEMASASPSSAGVYQWASITAGKHGRIVGYFAGWYVISGLLKHLATTNTLPCWNRIEVLDLVLVFAAVTQEGDFRVRSHGDMDLGRGSEIDGLMLKMLMRKPWARD